MCFSRVSGREGFQGLEFELGVGAEYDRTVSDYYLEGDLGSTGLRQF